MPPPKSATEIEADVSALRDWVLAHQGALAARASGRPGLRCRLRTLWSEDAQRWYGWLRRHDLRFEGDCSHLASQRRALDDLAAGTVARFEQPEPTQTPGNGHRAASPGGSSRHGSDVSFDAGPVFFYDGNPDSGPVELEGWKRAIVEGSVAYRAPDGTIHEDLQAANFYHIAHLGFGNSVVPLPP